MASRLRSQIGDLLLLPFWACGVLAGSVVWAWRAAWQGYSEAAHDSPGPAVYGLITWIIIIGVVVCL